MADQITKILIRKGTLAEKDVIILSEAELGYTTDGKRLYIGDGATTGGLSVGTKYFGSVDLTVNIANLSTATYGDIVYNTAVSTYQILSGTDNQDISHYTKFRNGTMTALSAGAGTIMNTADTHITGEGTINLVTDDTKLNPIVVSANGILADLDVIYPINISISTSTSVNPAAVGGVLEGSGQVWADTGYIGTSTDTLYTWVRTG
jgi:hypothetical protein